MEVETVPLESALFRVLAEKAEAQISVPPFPRSMMDGYAVRAEEVKEGEPLPCHQTIAAGDSVHHQLPPHEAVKIMTGAPVPEGANAILRREWCEEQRNAIVPLRLVHKGESIQNSGEDAMVGEVLLHPGIQLHGRHIASLKTFGVTQVAVYQLPRVAIVTSGSELVHDVNQPLAHGQIYATNDWLLRGALHADGIPVTEIRCVGDDYHQLRTTLVDLAKVVDVILLTGGASVGDFDYAPAILKDICAEIFVSNVYVRPGSHFLAGQTANTSIFVLSGNPFACFTQFETLVRPALRKRIGLSSNSFSFQARLLHPLHLKPIKHTRIWQADASFKDASLFVSAQTTQSPGAIHGLFSANCLIRLDESDYAEGDIVPLQWIENSPCPHIKCV